jgi:hypothetical protein
MFDFIHGAFDYFRDFDGAKALQVTYYSVALALASIGLWRTIRFAESKLPKRLLEYATREEGRIVEKSREVLAHIKSIPNLPSRAGEIDVNAEVDRAFGYLTKGDGRRAAAELQDLALRLDEKVKVATANLDLVKHQAASAQLFVGTLVQKVPELSDRSLAALRRRVASCELFCPHSRVARKDFGTTTALALNFASTPDHPHG